MVTAGFTFYMQFLIDLFDSAMLNYVDDEDGDLADSLSGNATLYTFENREASKQRGVIDFNPVTKNHVAFEPLLIPDSEQAYAHLPSSQNCAWHSQFNCPNSATEEHFISDFDSLGQNFGDMDVIGLALDGWHGRLYWDSGTPTNLIFRRWHSEGSSGESKATIDGTFLHALSGRISLRVSRFYGVGATDRCDFYYSFDKLTGDDPLNDVTWTLLGSAETISPNREGVGPSGQEPMFGLKATSSVVPPRFAPYRGVLYQNGTAKTDIWIDFWPDRDVTDFAASSFDDSVSGRTWIRKSPTATATEPDFSSGYLTFDGVDDFIRTNNVSVDTPHSIYALVKNNAPDATRYIYSCREGSTPIRGELYMDSSMRMVGRARDDSGNLMFRRLATLNVDITGIPTFGAFERRSTEGIVYSDQRTLDGGNAVVDNEVDAPENAVIGARGDSIIESYWDGDIYAIVVHETEAQDGDVEIIREALWKIKNINDLADSLDMTVAETKSLLNGGNFWDFYVLSEDEERVLDMMDNSNLLMGFNDSGTLGDPSHADRGLDFVGATPEYVYANDTAVNIPDGDFTLGINFFWDGNQTQQYLFSDRDSTNIRSEAYLNSGTDRLVLLARDDASNIAVVLNQAGELVTGENSAVFIRDGNTLSIAVNGNTANTVDISSLGTISTPAQGMKFGLAGNSTGGALGWNDVISKAILTPRAFTASQVTGLESYLEPSTTPPASVTTQPSANNAEDVDGLNVWNVLNSTAVGVTGLVHTGTSVLWEQYTDPAIANGAGTVTFSDATATSPTMTFSAGGEYSVRAKVSKTGAADIYSDPVRILVLDEVELEDMYDYLNDPSTIPANHWLNRDGAFSYGQDATVTEIAAAIASPDVTINSGNSGTAQTLINAASSGDVILFDSGTYSVGHIDMTGANGKTLIFVAKDDTTLTDSAIIYNLADDYGETYYNLKIDGLPASLEGSSNPMIKTSENATVEHCEFLNSKWRGLTPATDSVVRFNYFYRPGQYAYNITAYTGVLVELNKFEDSAWGNSAGDPYGIDATIDAVNNSGVCKISATAINNTHRKNLSINAVGSSWWVDGVNSLGANYAYFNAIIGGADSEFTGFQIELSAMEAADDANRSVFKYGYLEGLDSFGATVFDSGAIVQGNVFKSVQNNFKIQASIRPHDDYSKSFTGQVDFIQNYVYWDYDEVFWSYQYLFVRNANGTQADTNPATITPNVLYEDNHYILWDGFDPTTGTAYIRIDDSDTAATLYRETTWAAEPESVNETFEFTIDIP